MQVVHEFIDYEKFIEENEVLLFTANSTIDRSFNLVMGAGNAKACKQARPHLAADFGVLIDHHSEFHLCEVHVDLGRVMAFQTKIDWKNRTPMSLLGASIFVLNEKALSEPDTTFHLPCPGVNNGGLSLKKVMPMLQNLPDNVIVYYKE